MTDKNEELDILRIIEKKPKNNQRDLAQKLGLSLGKINYCLKELSKKGLIKIQNFKNNKNKSAYRYLITKKGIEKKTVLIINFLKQKSKEYENLQKEIEKIKSSKS